MASFLKSSRRYAAARVSAYQRLAKPKTATTEQKEQAADLAPRPTEARGAIKQLRECHDKEVLVEGPFGTGKTFGILQYLYELMDAHPGIRVLMLRKTRESMNETVLATWEEQIVPDAHPMLSGAKRATRSKYQHINGSQLILGGLHTADAIKKVFSGEYDIIYVPEAIEVTKAQWEALKGRLRSFRLPWQQIIGDTNPGADSHWLNRRCNRGLTRRLLSRHRDNPRYFDGENWTTEGLDYVEGTLASLEGAQRDRYYLGLWVANEGIVYPEFDPATHVISERVAGKALLPLPYSWRRIWLTDFGYSNPFVWQQWAIDNDGRAWREFEIYKTETLLDDIAAMIRKATEFKTPPPDLWLCDHDLQDRMELEAKLGIKTTAAVKTIGAGIDAVKTRLRDDASGLPRLLFCAGSLVHDIDRKLDEQGRPLCTEQEFAVYRWRETTEGIARDEPVKEHDHGMDLTRYLVNHLDDVSSDVKGDVGPPAYVVPRRAARRTA